MFRNPLRRRGEGGRPRSRATGCLLWILLLLALLIVLSILFGGFQKGTKVNNGLGVVRPAPLSQTTRPPLPSQTLQPGPTPRAPHS